MSSDFPPSEPEPGRDPAEATGSSTAGTTRAEAEAIGLRRKRRTRSNGAPTRPASHDEQIFVLSSLLASLMEKKNAEEPVQQREAKIYRFKGKSPETLQALTPGGEADLAGDAADAGAVNFEAPASEPEVSSNNAAEGMRAPAASNGSASSPTIRTATRVNPSFWRLPPEPPGSRTWLRMAYVALPILVGAAAFIAGRQTSTAKLLPRAAAPAETSPRLNTWSQYDLTRLAGILAADQAGDIESAYRVARDLRAQAGALPGLDVYLHLLEARSDRISDAQSDLAAMSNTGVEGPLLAAIENALAFTYTRERRFDLSSLTFKAAAMAAPFDPETFRLWGESLRHEGLLGQAAVTFRQALARYPVGAVEFMDAREYVKYKIRLCQIEGGLPIDARKETEEKAFTANSAGYWFLTDAAAALQRGDGKEAAAALRAAKESLPALFFNELLGDYFFRAYATRPEVAAFFPAGPDPRQKELRSQQVYFIDP